MSKHPFSAKQADLIYDFRSTIDNLRRAFPDHWQVELYDPSSGESGVTLNKGKVELHVYYWDEKSKSYVTVIKSEVF